MAIPDPLAQALQHHQAGRLAEADALYRQILARDPSHADALHLLGLLSGQRGRHADAIDLFTRATQIAPRNAAFHMNLGNAFLAGGQFDRAIPAYRQAIALDPNLGEAHNNLGNALNRAGQLPAAIDAYRRAIEINPAQAETYTNLGNALRGMGRLPEAMASLRQAVQLNPSLADAHYNLGAAFLAAGELDEAIPSFRQAIALNPRYAEAHNNLGNALKDAGLFPEALECYRRAIALKPADPELGGILNFVLHFPPELTPQAIAAEHFRWNERHALPLASAFQPHGNDRDPHRRLRVGYVSPDFCHHPVGRFLLPLLENHDKNLFEIFAYAQSYASDAVTHRLRARADAWRIILPLTDAQAADLIRRDRIDILVDLTGHTAHNRLMLFARKPAPVQITWLGYPNTTGLTAIDYRLTDAYADPPGQTEAFHSEKLLRLPHTAWCYHPDPSPDVPPRAGNDPFTFGCFNNFSKINQPLLRLWAEILLNIPASRLLLKTRALGTPSVRRRAIDLFQAAGIDPARLDLRGWQDRLTDHLSLYHQVDIALDTFPYHGTTTTCDALWMGVPVVTLAGSTHVSRVGVSLLSNLGLPDLIAASPGDYIQIATRLAGDLPRLAELRSTLRHRMQQSPLMDAPAFARAVEAAYRRAWQTWCETAPSP